jgi:hypothetical protein
VTAADRVAGALVVMATGFLAWVGLRSGGSVTVFLLPVLAGSSILAIQVHFWIRSTRRSARRLVARADGSLWLHTAGQAPCRMAIGAGTRLLGPSVFLDLLVASNPAGQPLRTWLTPLDAPTQAIRRLSVVLPRSGRRARS